MIVRKTFQRLAPSTVAASWRLGSIRDHTVDTVLTTTATLKKTCAARIAPIESENPSETNAVPTTTVGRTNGTVASAVASRRPLNSYVEIAHVRGAAANRVRRVERLACQTVNQPTRRSRASRPVAPMPISARPTPIMRATGYAKK